MIRIPLAFLFATILSLVACTKTDNVPQIVCEVNSVLPGLPGESIEYVFLVSSKKPLLSLEVITENAGHAVFKHEFRNEVFTDQVKYSYIVPKDIANTAFVQFKIVLRDAEGMSVTVQNLPVYNPPQMAGGYSEAFFE
ncbi:MAG TPA: hypothetical protein DCQ31_09340 [Bacteroidales bacterium]|nr:hypothetical protein [Bacteroidales bacterium]